MTEQEAEAFAARLTRVWVFTDKLRLYKWVYWPPLFRFDALLRYGVLCCLQEDGTFVLSRNRWIWVRLSDGNWEEVSVSAGELRCSPTGDITFPTANTQVGERQKDFDRFVNWWMPRFRRNCWLSGREVECTEVERRRWTRWLNRKVPPLPESETLSAPQARQLDWEARRIAAAFGVEAKPWYYKEDKLMRFAGYYTDDWVSVRWDLGEPFGELFDLTLSHLELENGAVTGLSMLSMRRFRGYWEMSDASKSSNQLNELMVRGLYRLGFEYESVLAQLPILSAHEKLELRLSLPREFWPKTWLEEMEDGT